MKLIKPTQAHEAVLQKVDEFLMEGYVTFNNVLELPLLEKLRMAVEDLHTLDRSTSYSPSISVDYTIVNIPESFQALIRKPPAYSLIKQLFGPDVSLLSVAMRHCEPGTPNQAWHIDYRRDWPISMPQHPLWAPFPTVVVAYYLDDLTMDNGPFWVVPRTQVGPDRPEYADISLPGEKPILVTAGSAIVFDAKVWHRGGGNLSNTPRRGIFLDYSLSWVARRRRFEGPYIDQLKMQADKELLDLLGLN